ncbi:ATPase domain-containing protein [Belnapia rosea]|uniref:Circadian clock protein KaiC n=1 Tax=Belnapia rosea TaxID=938405 RepID=A0A1G6QEK8_9PROT|nr:ATPase domain-containing protein [Belnapia rosea]SDC90738.1 circadian clock protein KaiC [Belnapia rosea]
MSATPAEVPDRLKTGVAWFDRLTHGGIPSRRLTVLLGQAGAGKTLLSCQIAASRAHLSGAVTVFAALEEPPADILRNAAGFSWDLQSLAGQSFHPIDLRPDPDMVFAGDFDLRGMLATLSAKARQTGAELVVLDGLDTVLGWLANPARRRAELARLGRWLEEEGLTGIVTAKADRVGAPVDALGPLEFAVSLVVALERREEAGGTLRALRITKYRGSPHSSSAHPLFFSRHGLEPLMWPGGDAQPAPQDRVGSGMARLDVLLGGGYLRGSTALLSGPPGTGKSTLAALFASHVCASGGRAVHVAFDEGPEQTIRNMRSVGIDLAAHRASGALRLIGLQPGRDGPEQLLSEILAAIEAHSATALVVDPISSLMRGGVADLGQSAVRRLVEEARARSMTALLTSLVDVGHDPSLSTLSAVSTIADAWIALGYAERGGERNRTLSIVKARGSAHSNQTREFIMTGEGCTLTDVYTAGGAVLLGTARMEREAELRRQDIATALQHQRRQRELQAQLAEAEVRQAQAALQLEATRTELSLLETAEAERRAMQEGARAQLAISRLADTPEGGGGA